MKKSTSLYILAFVIVTSSACKPKYEAPEFFSAEANLERFVMIGDGHSGGYMDDALYFYGQKHGLATLIGQQLELAGGGEFTTKFIVENSVGANSNGLARLKLDYKEDCKGDVSLSPIRIAAIGDLNIITASTFSGEALFRNFGIPGMRASQVISPNYAQFNPFFARIASSSSVSPLQDILSTGPTFFAVYLGLEECLAYARTGGALNNMPSLEDFGAAYSTIVEELKANGAKGVLATIPDVRSMPYFRTIPYNGLNADVANSQTLNTIFGGLGFTFQVGLNPFMIQDPEADNDFEIRPIQSTELLLLNIPLDSVKCFQMGSLSPFRNEFVLTDTEQQYLINQINGYNEIIRDLANAHNLALVETNTFYQNLFSGFIYNGVAFSAQFVSGGAFSLDGIHLNAKGNALLANVFIQSINKHYGGNIPALNAGAYNGVLFP